MMNNRSQSDCDLEEETSNTGDRTADLILRAGAGEELAFDELITQVSSRLCALAHRMVSSYPHVRRWEETDDVLQEALVRLYRGLKQSKPSTARDFFGLAATIMRRTLIDMSRHHFGVYGRGRLHQSGSLSEQLNQAAHAATPESTEPFGDLEGWTDFHNAVEKLPDEEKETFGLIWYTGLSQSEASNALGVSRRTIIRRMNRARLQLNDLLEDARSQA